jgi:type VI secretion system secreted protein VgrG
LHRIELAPRTTQLGLVETQDVYLGLSVPEILQQKLELHGFESEDVSTRLRDGYATRELIVQYGESDLAFVSRLAEEAGITLVFDADGDTDRLLLVDATSAFEELDAPLRYVERGEEDGLFDLATERCRIPSSYYVQDYNDRTPLVDPVGQHALEGEAAGGVVEYGSHARTPDEAAAIAKRRAEERLCRKIVHTATTTHLGALVGRRFRIADAPGLDERERLLGVAIEHELRLPVDGDATGVNAVYRGTLTALSGEVPFRPARTTPRPRMPGVVTGIVQPGPNGEVGGVARLTDDGRYTVQLHFDTADRSNQKASHPIRMAQPFAGRGNGMHFPLVPGTEVVVAFANGDPDRPVIVGALPNPLSPNPIGADEAHTHRIRSAAGVTLEFGIATRTAASR